MHIYCKKYISDIYQIYQIFFIYKCTYIASDICFFYLYFCNIDRFICMATETETNVFT